MKRNKGAFTLIEILIVIAILAVIAAILFPVMQRAKRNANAASTISNLRQCYVAMTLYLSDDNFAMLPVGDSAEYMLKDAPTHDNLDYWNKRGQMSLGSPLIGSYAYVRAVHPLESKEAWDGWWGDQQPKHKAIMISVFSGLEGVGYEFNQFNEVVPKDGVWPTKYHCLLADGSIHLGHIPTSFTAKEVGQIGMNFGWTTLFARKP